MNRKLLSTLFSILFVLGCLAVFAFPAAAVPASAAGLKLPKMQAVSVAGPCRSGVSAAEGPGSCRAVKTYGISSGSATWSWVQEDGQTAGIVIDAIAPWMSPNLETLPKGLCLLKWDTQPDSITVVPFTSKDGSTYEEVSAEVQTVSRPYVVNLKAGRVYVVIARWGENHLRTDGGCGEVEYAFRT